MAVCVCNERYTSDNSIQCNCSDNSESLYYQQMRTAKTHAELFNDWNQKWINFSPLKKIICYPVV